MAEGRLSVLPDDELALALRALGPAVDWPATPAVIVSPTAPGAPDLAALVRARIEAMPVPTRRRAISGIADAVLGWRGRSTRRALIVALAALLALAAIAGAAGLGLPGVRLLLGEPPASAPVVEPTTTPAGSVAAPLGNAMRLGDAMDPGDAVALAVRAGFTVALPADPALGPPAVAYVDDGRGGQVTLLWPVGEGLPPTLEPRVGLLLSEFRGTVNEGFFTKVLGNGTTLERVRVAGRPGFWISGSSHVLFWEGPSGSVDDPRRWVGDVLLWSDGLITYRLESALGRDETIRLAETMR